MDTSERLRRRITKLQEQIENNPQYHNQDIIQLINKKIKQNSRRVNKMATPKKYLSFHKGARLDF
jgi:hypothetical protein